MDADEQIGRNIARFRGEMSQKELAEQMKLRGFKWAQATVWNVERGERPLRLVEAQAVASILGTWVDRLLASEGEAVVVHWMGEMSKASNNVNGAVRHYLETQEQLLMAAEQYPPVPGSTIESAVIDWVGNTPIRNVTEVLRRVAAEDQIEADLDWAGATDEQLKKRDQEMQEQGKSPFVAAYRSWQTFDAHRSEAL